MTSSLKHELNVQPSRFAQEGYCVFPKLLDEAEVLEARHVLDAAISALPSQTVVRNGVEVEEAVRPEHMSEPHLKDEFWLQLCCHPRVLDAVESVLGPNLVLLMSHLIVKRAGDGLKVEWHQDNTTWDAVQGTDIVTVWLALDDADTENGCMRVVPCSQAGYPDLEKRSTDHADLLGLKVDVTPEMEADAVAIELRAGGASVHDSYILHGSEPNLSPRRRAGYTMRYGNALTTRVNLDDHWAPVYLVRGEAGPDGARYLKI